MSLKQLCFSYKGRINRKIFWIFNFFYLMLWFVFVIVLSVIYGGVDSVSASPSAMAIFLAYWCIMSWMESALAAKRFHDTNRSGWCILIGLIPFVGGLYCLVVLGCLKGPALDNKYGPPSPTFIQWRRTP